jgi:hypothetical protein
VLERLISIDPEVQIARMGIAQAINELNAAKPFSPYEIKMVSGEYYSVGHPEFVAVFPRGDVIWFYKPGDVSRKLNALLIEWVE